MMPMRGSRTITVVLALRTAAAGANGSDQECGADEAHLRAIEQPAGIPPGVKSSLRHRGCDDIRAESMLFPEAAKPAVARHVTGAMLSHQIVGYCWSHVEPTHDARGIVVIRHDDDLTDDGRRRFL